jgi:hypothetical protein
MFGHEAREARAAQCTERYLEQLMSADERHAPQVPVDLELDPSVRLATRQLRADLMRVHPSFRFEEGLATRLAMAAARLQAGLPIDPEVTIPAPAQVISLRPQATPSAAQPAALRVVSAVPAARSAASGGWKLPSFASKPPRPLIVGGVGVASAALSIGAVYIAWRWTHPSPGPMARAARAAHANRSPGGLRSAVLGGILGVVS